MKKSLSLFSVLAALAGSFLLTQNTLAATPTYYKNGGTVGSITCGETYTFGVAGYSESSIWLEQVKNGTRVYTGKFDVPMPAYTAVCRGDDPNGVGDEGSYETTVYQLTYGAGVAMPGTLLGSTNFTINPLPTPTPTPTPSFTPTPTPTPEPTIDILSPDGGENLYTNCSDCAVTFRLSNIPYNSTYVLQLIQYGQVRGTLHFESFLRLPVDLTAFAWKPGVYYQNGYQYGAVGSAYKIRLTAYTSRGIISDETGGTFNIVQSVSPTPTPTPTPTSIPSSSNISAAAYWNIPSGNSAFQSRWDYDNNGVMNYDDSLFLGRVVGQLSSCPTGKNCDFNGSGSVNVGDPLAYLIFLQGQLAVNQGTAVSGTLVLSSTSGGTANIGNVPTLTVSPSQVNVPANGKATVSFYSSSQSTAGIFSQGFTVSMGSATNTSNTLSFQVNSTASTTGQASWPATQTQVTISPTPTPTPTPTTPTIQITAPNGGENWYTSCSNCGVGLQLANVPSNATYVLQLIQSNQVRGTLHPESILPLPSSLVRYDWVPGRYYIGSAPYTAVGADYKIRLTAYTTSGVITDESNGSFNIIQGTTSLPPTPTPTPSLTPTPTPESSYFTFSHNNGTLVATREAWRLSLMNGRVGDKMWVNANLVTDNGRTAVSKGTLQTCTVTSGTSCSLSSIPPLTDVGVWYEDVYINGENKGKIIFTVTAPPASEADRRIDQTRLYTLSEINDGDIIRGEGDIAVWIVKIVGEKRFKRWLFGPQIFQAYGHLGFDRVKNVSKTTLSNFDTAVLIRKDGDAKVYELTDFVPGTRAVRRWIQNEQTFLQRGFDFDSVYVVNEREFNLYTEGASLSVAPNDKPIENSLLKANLSEAMAKFFGLGN